MDFVKVARNEKKSPVDVKMSSSQVLIPNFYLEHDGEYSWSAPPGEENSDGLVQEQRPGPGLAAAPPPPPPPTAVAASAEDSASEGPLYIAEPALKKKKQKRVKKQCKRNVNKTKKLPRKWSTKKDPDQLNVKWHHVVKMPNNQNLFLVCCQD